MYGRNAVRRRRAGSGVRRGSGAGDAAAAGPVEITVAAQSGHTATNAVKDKLADFEAATGIKVNVVEIPEKELTQKMLLEFSNNTGTYDALMAPEDAFAKYVLNGYLLPLKEAGTEPDTVGLRPALSGPHPL